MEQEIGRLLGVLLILAVIILCIKDKIKIASSIIIFYWFFYTLVLGLIYQFSFPVNQVVEKADPGMLYALATSLLVLSISPYIVKFAPKANKEPSFMRWVLLFLGVMSVFTGLFGAFSCLYTPQTFGHEAPMAMHAVITNITMVAISTVFLYAASGRNSYQRPNLMRKVVLLILYFFFSYIPLILSFILIYAPPIQPVRPFPEAASVSLVAYLFMGLLVFFVAKDEVDIGIREREERPSVVQAG